MVSQDAVASGALALSRCYADRDCKTGAQPCDEENSSPSSFILPSRPICCPDREKVFTLSFGFAPSDIVLFTKFVDKVISALQDDQGGSQYDYRLAKQQCQDYLTVMEELQRLDFSNIPHSFQDKIKGYAANVTEIVADFKSAIAGYEKSMGKATKRGPFKSAPRKVQWAFRAADDINKFRQRLAAQLELVKLMFNMSLL
jgi:hypothetical protein